MRERDQYMGRNNNIATNERGTNEMGTNKREYIFNIATNERGTNETGDYMRQVLFFTIATNERGTNGTNDGHLWIAMLVAILNFKHDIIQTCLIRVPKRNMAIFQWL